MPAFFSVNVDLAHILPPVEFDNATCKLQVTEWLIITGLTCNLQVYFL
jgi:hypothetical protein